MKVKAEYVAKVKSKKSIIMPIVEQFPHHIIVF